MNNLCISPSNQYSFYILFSFTGLAGSFISKAIQKYLSKERLRIPSCVVEEIVSSSNGDLRSALNGVNWIAKSKNLLIIFKFDYFSSFFPKEIT